ERADALRHARLLGPLEVRLRDAHSGEELVRLLDVVVVVAVAADELPAIELAHPLRAEDLHAEAPPLLAYGVARGDVADPPDGGIRNLRHRNGIGGTAPGRLVVLLFGRLGLVRLV